MNVHQAADRLHHLSMRYCGAFMELLSGAPVSFIPQGHPGLKEVRDFIDLILLTRAEINGLTRVLAEAKLITVESIEKIFAEEYQWLTEQKAKQFNVEVTDAGLKFNKDSK